MNYFMRRLINILLLIGVVVIIAKNAFLKIPLANIQF